jgi:mannose-6-phosphate isomerase
LAQLHPIRLEASLHETIWGGRRLAQDAWKQLLPGARAVGETWETELSTLAQNDPYTGKTLGELVEYLGVDLLGKQVIALYGHRFPLLAKFIDANTQLSVQVHPNDEYAAQHERCKLGKTEFWYVLTTEPGATIVHGFKAATSRAEVQQAIEDVTLDRLLHEEVVHPGDVIFLPAGTVHAIGSGVLLYEIQEYSDLTYRMYDYGRLTAAGNPRELHIQQSLDVSYYDVSPRIKMKPVALPGKLDYEDRCLVACKYFVSREIALRARNRNGGAFAVMDGRTDHSCIIFTSLGADVQVRYGPALSHSQCLTRGQTMVLPASLGDYRIEGTGVLVCSYVPSPDDEAWKLWAAQNQL